MIISRTPLRVSFVGGGTDFPEYSKRYGGMVISTAIDKYVYVTVNKKFDSRIHVRYSQIENVETVAALKHDLVREALRMTGISKGIEIAIISDIPAQGSGLGSSSSLAVGLLKALYRYKGYDISARELADKACRLEIDKLRAPIGRQDQYAAAYGGFNLITFTGAGMIEVENLYKDAMETKMSWLKDSTMLFYLNGRNSNDILVEHKKSILDKSEVLASQKALVIPFYQWLVDGVDDLDKTKFDIGNAILQSWGFKKSMTPQASSPEIESIFIKALEAGALGAKLCGAGGGGFLLVICEPAKQQEVILALKGYFHLQFDFERSGAQVIYVD